MAKYRIKALALRIAIFWDKLRGLDFLPVVQAQQVGLDPKIVFHSSPSGNRYLRAVLSKLHITSKDSIVDIGCGKGSAMRTMLKFPFFRVDGIELSESIFSTALVNFQRLGVSNSKVFHVDATAFAYYGDYNFVYMYNPFPAEIMSRVMELLTASIKSTDREIILIYNNPTCDITVMGGGCFAKLVTHPGAHDNIIAVYSSIGRKSLRLRE
jgi:hypothetical protein